MRIVRWGFYADVPVGFGRVVICDFGWVHGDWIGALGWRYAR